jgi:hypothetical protein
LNFITELCLQSKIVSLSSNPQYGGQGPRIYVLQ